MGLCYTPQIPLNSCNIPNLVSRIPTKYGLMGTKSQGPRLYSNTEGGALTIWQFLRPQYSAILPHSV